MNIIENYNKQLEQVQKEQNIVFKDLTALLETSDKELIIKFIEKIALVHTNIKKNIKLLNTEKIEDRKRIENNIQLNIYEYWIYIIETKLDLLQRSFIDLLYISIAQDAENYRKEVYKELINNTKQK